MHTPKKTPELKYSDLQPIKFLKTTFFPNLFIFIKWIFSTFQKLINISLNKLNEGHVPKKKRTDIISILRDFNLFDLLTVSAALSSFFLILSFDTFYSSYQYLEFGSLYRWYFLIGYDPLSMNFLHLSSFLFSLCSLTSTKYAYRSNREFQILLLLSSTALTLLFVVLDIFFFYFFFEFLVLPFFLFFCLYSQAKRKDHAAYFFMFFTIAGSIFLLFDIIYLFYLSGSTNYFSLITQKLSYQEDSLLGIILFISLIFKVPTYPVHVWLPEAHVEAPTEGSIILAGILLKLSAYAFLRFFFPLFEFTVFYYTPFFNILFIISVIYICLITLRQLDIKRVIAYSSIFHMNIAFLALFLNNIYAEIAFYYMMISHAYVSGGLFLSVGVLYHRTKEKHIFTFGEIQSTMPIFSFFFFMFILGNIGFPGTSGFIAELYMVIAFAEDLKVSLFLVFFASALIGTSYNILLFSRIVFLTNNKKTHVRTDIDNTEFSALASLLLPVALLGFFPDLLIQSIIINPSL